MRKPFSAVIVDDERLARNRLKSLLSEHPEIQVVGEADSVQKALEVIKATKPDILFLDIQMPGESGFDLLDKIEVTFEVIFVTAFDEYAIRAFEVNALDYLLKPVHPERLANAIKRLSESESATKVEKEKKEIRKLEYDDRRLLTVNNSYLFLKISSIKCIRAEGDYSEIVTSDGKKFLDLTALKEWEERLPEKYFARIHRATIINLEYVDKVEKWFGYSYKLYLRDLKEPFDMSYRYFMKLRGKLK